MFSSGFQQLSSGLELMCNASHSGGKTTYNIQNIPNFMDTKTSKLEFSWITPDNHVLANHLDQMKQVMSRSFNSLVTSSCFQNVSFEGHIILERAVQDYSANCTTTCPSLADDKGKFPAVETLPFWIAVLVILVFLVLAGFMVYRLCSRRS